MAKKIVTTSAAAVATAMATFRLVIRGNDADGKRVRRCKNIQASSMDEATVKGEAMAEEVAKGLEGIYFNVYPPVGELCNGGLSKGYELVDGLVVKTGKAPVVAAKTPAPAAAPAKTPRKRVVKAVAPAAAPAAAPATTTTEAEVKAA